ncbi:MAG: hypothetical protein SGPRY_007493 [Prymnesium sp.]
MSTVRALHLSTHVKREGCELGSRVPWRRGEMRVSELLATSHTLTPSSRITVRAELRSVERLEGEAEAEGGGGKGCHTLKLGLVEAGGAARVDLYLDGGKVRLPDAILAGAHVRVSDALAVVGRASGRLYLRAAEETALTSLWSPLSHELCATYTPHHPIPVATRGEGHSPLLASSSAPAALCELLPTPCGEALAKRVLRLQLTLRGASGACVWALLGSSSALVRALRGITAAKGPISCRLTLALTCAR